MGISVKIVPKPNYFSRFYESCIKVGFVGIFWPILTRKAYKILQEPMLSTKRADEKTAFSLAKDRECMKISKMIARAFRKESFLMLK